LTAAVNRGRIQEFQEHGCEAVDVLQFLQREKTHGDGDEPLARSDGE
jgi:hypothetical protein